MNMAQQEREMQMIGNRLDAVRKHIHLVDGKGIKCPKCHLYMDHDLGGLCDGPECCPEWTDVDARTIPASVFKDLLSLYASIMNSMGPRYHHYCNSSACVFLGQHEEYDLYACPPTQNFYARAGHDEDCFAEKLLQCDPLYEKIQGLAHQQGLLILDKEGKLIWKERE